MRREPGQVDLILFNSNRNVHFPIVNNFSSTLRIRPVGNPARCYSHNRRTSEPLEDKLVRSLPAAQAAARMGRTLRSVYNRRVELKLPDGRAANGQRAVN